jgi:uncharacterized protein (DUF2336 family)
MTHADQHLGPRMVEHSSFLAELEEAVSRGTAESCSRALWRATDILIAGSYSEDEIWTFGEVIDRLANEIEASARARLARTLAKSNNAPFRLVKRLASDQSIEVAGPVLQQSDRLDVETLISFAKSQGQQHLLAISKRRSVPAAVTDVLVIRGSNEVLTSVAANSGATFSNFGFLHLVRRSEADSILAESVGLRKDIPRHLFHQLISKASEEVRRKLESERPDVESHIQTIVGDVAGALHARFGPASKDYFTAKKTVAKLHRRGELTEDKLFEFAYTLKFNEAAVALALLCSLPIDIVERALLDRDRKPLLIIAKALNLAWPTAMALLFLGAPNYRITAGDLDRMKTDFAHLNAQTSQRVLATYRSRKEAASEAFSSVPRRFSN